MIHPSAIIHSKATIGAGCEIGPFCVIGESVTLGDHCKLHSHVVIDGHTQAGNENEFFPFTSIGLKTQDLKWKGGITRVRIGDKNVFREGVTVHSATNDGDATVIGNGNLFLAQVHVAHDCQLGNGIIMSSFAALAGHVVVEDHATFGGYAAAHQFCRIGTRCMVGGYTRLSQDVAPYIIVEGNPPAARAINKVGLERAGMATETQSALRCAYKIIFREDLPTADALKKVEAELPPFPEVKHLVQFIRASERGVCK